MADTDLDISSTPRDGSDRAAGRPATLPDGCIFEAHEWEVLAGYWYPVAWSEDVTDAPIASTLLDEDLVLYRTPGGAVVARDLCLHRGSRLTLGRIEGAELVCRYHGVFSRQPGQGEWRSWVRVPTC